LNSNPSTRAYIIPFFILPIFPALTIIVELTQSDTILPFFSILDPSFVPKYVPWISLVLAIPAWFFIYLYLDSVMPNTYGISKHPLFCFRNKKKNPSNFVESQDISNSEDPI
jgi:hypothetical protein